MMSLKKVIWRFIMELDVPKTSLIVLCGTAGCGKSTFAQRNFKPTEIVSSDWCRAIVSDDESDIDASKEAFELFYNIIEMEHNGIELIH
jgi:protein phosphatase